jgi:hypothetical protein
MRGTTLASLGGLVAAALLATLWWQRDGVTPVEATAVRRETALAPVSTVASPGPDAAVSTLAGARADATGLRASEAELRARAAEQAHARIGGVLVDYLAARGLARADGEPVVRRFLNDNVRCFFDALHLEADAQSAAYDSVLDAVEAELYKTDGPLLGAVIDLRAVQNRVEPCALAAAQQAGIEPAALPEATRAAIVDRLR